MLSLLLLLTFFEITDAANVNILKFNIYPNASLGKTLPVSIYELHSGLEQFHHKVNSIAQRRHNHLQGFALVHTNNSGTVALLKLIHQNLDQNSFAISLNSPRPSRLRISTGELKINLDVSTLPLRYLNLIGDDENSCSCVKGNCACCTFIRIPDFHHEFCVNATYNRENVGLDLSIGIDGHYYTQEISLRNPPPICMSVPFAEDIAGVCVALTDLDLSKEKRTLSGCVELEVEIVHLRVVHVRLGCFVMPI